MNTLFDLDTIPEVEANAKPKQATRFYIHVQGGDGWYFLWKTHANGGPVWENDFHLTINGGRKKPLFYKTLAGANRMMREYLSPDANCKVEVWHEPT